MTRTKPDELYMTLYHLRAARKSLLRTDWTAPRDDRLVALDRLYRAIQNDIDIEKARERKESA